MSISIPSAVGFNRKNPRRSQIADKRMSYAIATMDMLERRQLLSGTPFSHRVGPAVSDINKASYASVIADINGDGIPDLIIADGDGKITIFDGIGKNGHGTGYFRYDQSINDGLGAGFVGPNDLVVATLENGHPDIIVANGASSGGEGEISIMFGDGKGGFRQNESGGEYFGYQGSSFPGASGGSGGEGGPDAAIYGIAVGDVNNDGIPDIVTACNFGQINVLLGHELQYSYFTSPLAYTVASTDDRLTEVAVADVNGDGQPDIVYLDESTGNVNVLLHSTGYDATYSGSYFPFYNSSPQSVNNGPYNKNVDAFALTYNTYFSLPELATVQNESDGSNQVSILFGDYNANIIKNIKSPTVFGAYQSFSVSAGEGFDGYARPVFGDINGDGAQDLMVVQYGYDNGDYHIAYVTAFYGNTDNGYLNNPSGFGKTFDDSGDDYTTQAITFGDLNGDGQTDAVVTYYGSGGGDTYSYAFLGTVGQGPQFTSPYTTTFDYEQLGSFQVTTSGHGTPTITVENSEDLPQGISLTDDLNGTATLTGVPKQYGEFEFTLEAVNGDGPPAFQNFYLYIDKAPSFQYSNAEATTSPGEYTFIQIGQGISSPAVHPSIPEAYYHDTLYSGYSYAGSNEKISIENGTLPPGLTFHDSGGGDATITGTPLQGDGGPYFLTLEAQNGLEPPTTQQLEIDISPTFTSGDSVEFAIGVNSSFTISTTASDADIFTDSNLPAGLSLHNNGDGTATISGTPTASDKGTHGIVLFAENDGGEVDQSFNIVINKPVSPKITSPNKANFFVGQPGSFTFTTTGFPSGTLALNGDDLPDGLSYHDNGNGTATISGTPVEGSGGFYFETLTDHNGSPNDAVQAFTLIVNETLVITSSNATTYVTGESKTFEVITSGSPTAALSVSGLPSGLHFHDDGDGTGDISGTPSSKAGGTYKVTITAKNSNGTVKQTLTLQVDQAPALKNFTSAPTFNLTLDKPFTTAIALSGAGTPITLSDVSGLPAGLFLSTTNNGTALLLSGTPTGSTGTFTITFTLTNADDNLISDLSIKVHIA